MKKIKGKLRQSLEEQDWNYLLSEIVDLANMISYKNLMNGPTLFEQVLNVCKVKVGKVSEDEAHNILNSSIDLKKIIKRGWFPPTFSVKYG